LSDGESQAEARDEASPFDRLTSLAATLFETPAALVSITEGPRQLFPSRLGIGAPEVDRENAFTPHAVALGDGGVLVVEDAAADPRFKDSIFVTGEAHVRFYAGAVITTGDGRHVGALCVLDRTPRGRPDEAKLEALKSMARLAADMLDKRERMRVKASKLEMLDMAEAMSGVGHWRLDVATNRVTWSDQVYHVHGLDPGAFDPNLGSAIDAYHPEDRETIATVVRRAIEDGEPYDVRLKLLRPDGDTRLVRTKGSPQRDDAGRVTVLFGVFQDITEQEAALARARQNERRYRLLADNMADVLARVKPDGHSNYISPAAEAIIGYSRAEMFGTTAQTYVLEEDRPIFMGAMAEVLETGENRRVQYRVRRKSGESIWVETQLQRVENSRGEGEVIIVIRDISDRKILEDDLMAARDRAEAAARAKSEFLANMSHELRTPLTSVVGFAGLLGQSRTLGDEERRYVERIAAGSEALLAVINDILDYSKLEAGAVELDPHRFDPLALAQAGVELMEGQCRSKGLDLRLETDLDMPEGLIGDSARLRQVLLNFLSNAVKFTASGGVTVSASCEPGTDGRVWLSMSVKDTGVGVSDEQVEQLFDRFTQADASTTRTFGGTGLGLAISRQLVEMMGGEIGAFGRPGEGSTFWFQVPLPLADAGEERGGVEAVAAVGAARILMADDAPANRELVSVLLGGMGLTVDTVENGAEAVEAVRQEAYDLVLMDVHMPVMDGLDAARAIRALGGAAGRIPIIALTANVGREQVQTCLEAGMNGHLAKPIDVSHMARTLSQWLNPPAVVEAAG
jgi:PAS domain S-box-containing protein